MHLGTNSITRGGSWNPPYYAILQVTTYLMEVDIMMQGDSYNLGINILNNAGSPVTPDDVKDVEITIGHLRKTYLNAEVTYYDGVWLFPLSQKETFGYWPSPVKAQVRVMWANGVIEGKPLYGVRVNESISKEEM